jgi:hypothetical protein
LFRLQEEFEEHAEKAKTLPDTTTNENKLILYGLYKQATVGDVNTGMYAFFILLMNLVLLGCLQALISSARKFVLPKLAIGVHGFPC